MYAAPFGESKPSAVRSVHSEYVFISARKRSSSVIPPVSYPDRERQSSSDCTMAGSGAAFRTDVQVKTSLTSGLLPGSGGNRRGERAGGPARGQEAEATSDEYLARFEEDLHKKVDTEIGTLVDGLADCVALAKVGHSLSEADLNADETR